MSVIKAYSSNSAKVGIDGVPLAGVTIAEEYERHSEYPVLGFGDCVPSAILTFAPEAMRSCSSAQRA